MYSFEMGMGDIDFEGEGLPAEVYTFSQITMSGDVASIVVKNVALGNIEQMKTGQKDRTNIAGEARPLKQSYWPTMYRLQLRFNHISQCNDIDVIQFLEDTVGQEIDLTDPRGVVWVGVITSPQAEITRHHTDSFTLDFEGVKK